MHRDPATRKRKLNAVNLYFKHMCIYPQPNCRFNADANTGHGFAILLASVGALRASRSGAG
jgi:hypothetical protein